MKRMVYLLAVMLLLTACAARNEMPSAQSSAPAVSAPAEEVFPDPGGQQMAIDAYDSILRAFGAPNSEDGYPEEFADAYIGEDNFLYVCLTDTSEEVLSYYRGAVTEPRILRFVQVEHSYNDLLALQMALVEINGLDFSYIGVDVTGNKVDIGIPDISKEAEDRALIETSLPAEVRERFDELPIAIEESPYASFG